MKHTNLKRTLLNRFDKLLMAMIAALVGLTIASCEDPDQPAPEYGVQPMYGAPATMVDTQKTLDQ